MKIIKPSTELQPQLTQEAIDSIYKTITACGNTSYLGDKELTPEYTRKFVKDRIKEGHESVLEHAVMRVKFVVDRGVSHELVRHRLAAITQESTRYCNYSKGKFDGEVTVIDPVFYNEIPEDRKEKIRNYFTDESCQPADLPEKLNSIESRYADWFYSCYTACETYNEMLQYGATPEEARSVLPNSTKTTVCMTANFREWRHIFKLRAIGTTGKPHPQMVEVMLPLLRQCQKLMPEIFGDIQFSEKEIKE